MLIYLSEEEAKEIIALLPTYIEQLEESSKDSAPFKKLLEKIKEVE